MYSRKVADRFTVVSSWRDGAYQAAAIRASSSTLVLILWGAILAYGQLPTQHGKVTQVGTQIGDQARIELLPNWEVRVGSQGQIYGTQSYGGQTIATPSAEVQVVRVEGQVLICEIISISGGHNPPTVGQQASFEAARFLQVTTRLSVRSEPSGADVWIGGRLHGTTPLELELPPKRYTVRIQKSGLKTEEKTVDLVRGQPFNLIVNMVTARGTLSVRSNPDSASVWVDDSLRGVTPLTVDLPIGNYTIRFEKKGWKSQMREVDVRAGQTSSVSADLETDLGFITVASEPDSATVVINEQEVGMTVLTYQLPPGTHIVKVWKDSTHEAVEREVQISSGAEQRLTITLQEILGTLAVESVPEDSRVYLNDTFFGVTPLQREQAPGIYEMRIENPPDFDDHQEPVKIERDKTTNVSVDLLPSIRLRAADELDGNVRDVSVSRDRDEAVIRYTLIGEKEAYEVKAALSVDGGRSYPIELKLAEGDIGESVTPDSGKTIVWAYRDELPIDFAPGDYPIRVTASRPGGGGTKFLIGGLVAGLVGAGVAIFAGGNGGESPNPDTNSGFPPPPAKPN